MRNLGKLAITSPVPAFPARPPGLHALGGDAEVTAYDCVCRLGVRSPVCHGAFARAKISVTLSGAYHVRSSAGGGLAGPGALVLGNPAASYETRHLDDGGDRSIMFSYAGGVLDEVAAALALAGPPRFRAAIVPASPAASAAVAVASGALETGDPEALHEAGLAVAMIAIAAERGAAAPSPSPSHAQARRIARALRYIEAHSADDCSLAALAAEARLSRCHFLRVFRAMTGQTPRQHVIATRLAAAARQLRTSRTPITRIAGDAGFRDLSHFTTSFTRVFGASPRVYRKRSG